MLHFKFIYCLRIRGRIETITLLSEKNCGIPYSFLPSLTITNSEVQLHSPSLRVHPLANH
jgi:hypothetical protein